MRGKLPALMSLFVLMALTEGDVFLCKQDPKTTTLAYDGEHKDIIFRSNNERNEELDLGLDDRYDGATNRKEASVERVLWTRLLQDSEAGEFKLREEDSEAGEFKLREEDSEAGEFKLREEDSEAGEFKLRAEDSETFDEQYGFDY